MNACCVGGIESVVPITLTGEMFDDFRPYLEAGLQLSAHWGYYYDPIGGWEWKWGSIEDRHARLNDEVHRVYHEIVGSEECLACRA